MTGSHDASGQTGAGSLIMDGVGTLKLDADNTFTGGITIKSGTVELAAVDAAGTGPITFDGAASLVLDPAGGAFQISGFGSNDTIDVNGVGYSAVITSDGTTPRLATTGAPGNNLYFSSSGSGSLSLLAIETATTEAALNADIAALNNQTTPGAYVIDIAAPITLDTALSAIDLHSGVSLTIEGTNSSGGAAPLQTIDGNEQYQGLSVEAGNVTIDNLLIQNAAAEGGSGQDGGGGDPGLGGGLFVGSAADVTLNSVSFGERFGS